MKLIKTVDAVGHVLCHDMTQIIPGTYKDARQVAAGATSTIDDPAPVEVSLADAVALADGVRVIVKGTVKEINTAWSDQYKNITVTIIVEGREDKPIMCYRLKGEGAENLKVGDEITVTGILKNYKGTIEFDAGCALVSVN